MKNSASKIEQHALSLHEGELAGGSTRVADLKDRKIATVVGTIRSLTLRPSSVAKSLEAELEDGTGIVVVVWVGRRSITGVTAGTDIEVRGLMSRDSKGWRTFNPTYKLLRVRR